MVAVMGQFHRGLFIRLLYIHKILHLHSIGGEGDSGGLTIFWLHGLKDDFLFRWLNVDNKRGRLLLLIDGQLMVFLS